jgi:predicted Zn-dependent protease
MNLHNQSQAYEGGAFHKSLKRGRASGKISVTSSTINFETQGFGGDLSLMGIRIKAGGANERMVFFIHPSKPELTVYTADRTVLNDVNLASQPDLIWQIKDIQTKKRNVQIIIGGLILAFLFLIYGVYKLKNPAVNFVASKIPAAWEQKLGETVFAQLKAGRTFVDNPEIMETMDKMVKPLLSTIPDRRYDFRLHIVHDTTMNAFALPGGHIVFHTGLVLKAETPEEITGVLAHEAAHVTCQHGLRHMINSAGIFMIVQALFGDATGILAVIAENGAFLLTQKYSRDNEREADDRAWDYLVNANINPEGMLGFFNKLLEMQEKKNGGELESAMAFLSTHPTTRERIRRLQDKYKNLEQRSGFMYFELDFRKFQESIKNSGKNTDNLNRKGQAP